MARKATKHQQELEQEPQAAATEAELRSFFRDWARVMSEAEVLWTLALKTDEPIVVRWLANRAALERVGRIDKAMSGIRRLGMVLGAKAESPESPAGRGAAFFGAPTAEHHNRLRDHIKRLETVQKILDTAYGISNTPPDISFVDESIEEGYISDMDEAAKAIFKPAADYLGLPVEVLWKSGVEARKKAVRETTARATAEPRSEVARAASVAAAAEPVEKSPRRHTRHVFTERELRDPETVNRARDILADVAAARRAGEEISNEQRQAVRWADALIRKVRQLDAA